MNHIVVMTPIGAGDLKVFAPNGELLYRCEARNDAIGGDGYGHFERCPPGDYHIAAPETNDPPTIAEGQWFIPLVDTNGLWTANGRGGIGIHGGGSASPDPLAPRQGFYPTEGCIRLQNVDLFAVVAIVRAGDLLSLIQ